MLISSNNLGDRYGITSILLVKNAEVQRAQTSSSINAISCSGIWPSENIGLDLIPSLELPEIAYETNITFENFSFSLFFIIWKGKNHVDLGNTA